MVFCNGASGVNSSFAHHVNFSQIADSLGGSFLCSTTKTISSSRPQKDPGSARSRCQALGSAAEQPRSGAAGVLDCGEHAARLGCRDARPSSVIGAVVNPLFAHHAAGLWLLSVVDEDAATSCDQIDRASQSSVARGADSLPNIDMSGFARSCVPATGPRYRMTNSPSAISSSFLNYAATSDALVQRAPAPASVAIPVSEFKNKSPTRTVSATPVGLTICPYDMFFQATIRRLLPPHASSD
jgi:hypothetical protein